MEIKGKYSIPFSTDITITDKDIVSKKIAMVVKGKEETWFDTSVKYTDKTEYKESDTWMNQQLVSFWEEQSKGATEELAKVLVMGNEMLSLFTGTSQNQTQIQNMTQDKKLLSTWYKPFKGVKGPWKELSEFCEYMKKTKGKNVLW